MAVDTRNKRASILGLAFAAALVLPVPDATVAQVDRQQVTYSYAGISANAFVSAATIDIVGSYVTTVDIVGSYVTTVDIIGSYVPTIDIIGDVA